MSLELKPCPMCCMSVAHVTTSSEMWPEHEDEGNAESYAVICDAHKPDGPGGCGASGGFRPTEAEAIAAWNRRADSVTPPAPESRTLTGEQIERHQMLAGACPPGSEVMLASSIRRLLGMDAVPDRDCAVPSVAGPVAHSEQWWLHRIDMEKTQAWQQGYSQGLNRAHPPRAPLTDAGIDGLVEKAEVDSLAVTERHWQGMYRFARLVESAIPASPKTPLTDAELDTIYRQYGTGRPEGFLAAARAVLAAAEIGAAK